MRLEPASDHELLSSLQDKARPQEYIWKINAGGCTVYANQRMAEMLGTTVDAMLGQLSFRFVFPEDVEVAKRTVRCEKTRGWQTLSIPPASYGRIICLGQRFKY